MKSLYLLSCIGVATLSCPSLLKAEPIIPELHTGLPSTYEDCLAKKGCSEASGGIECLIRSAVPQAWQDLCEDLKKCESEESDDNIGWDICIGKAQGHYQEAINPAAAAGRVPHAGEELPVHTIKEEAHYRFLNNHKGYFNAEVGGH